MADPSYEIIDRSEDASGDYSLIPIIASNIRYTPKFDIHTKYSVNYEAFFDILKFSLKESLEDKDKGKWMTCKYFSNSFQHVSFYLIKNIKQTAATNIMIKRILLWTCVSYHTTYIFRSDG